jgi:flagellar basal body-associated protein FliL
MTAILFWISLWSALTLAMVGVWTIVAYWSSPEEQAEREREESRSRAREWAKRHCVLDLTGRN